MGRARQTAGTPARVFQGVGINCRGVVTRAIRQYATAAAAAAVPLHTGKGTKCRLHTEYALQPATLSLPSYGFFEFAALSGE